MTPSRIDIQVPTEEDSALACKPWKLPVKPYSFAQEYCKRYLGREGESSWEEGLRELDELGFQKVFEVESLSHDHALNPHLRDGKETPESYGVWWHPAGVIAVGRSHKRQFSKLQISIELDVGTGADQTHQKMKGLQSSVRMSDGTRRVQVSVNVMDQSSLRSALSVAQSCGKLVPVESWVGQRAPQIDAEMKLPIRSFREWGYEQERSLYGDKQEAEEKLLSLFPERIRAVFWKKHQGWAERAREFDALEVSHQEINEALSLSGIRWPSEPDKEVLERWFKVAQGKSENAQTELDAETEGPGGTSLATILMFSNQEQNSPPEKLLELIKKASPKRVKKWLGEADGAHYTLGLRLLWSQLQASENSPYSQVETTLEIADALLEKSGPENWVMETKGRTVLGLLMQTETAAGGNMGLGKKQKNFMATIEHLRARGIHMGLEAGARWRSLETIDQTRKSKTREFLSVGTAEEWLEAMSQTHRVTPATLEIASWVTSEVLDKKISKTAEEKAKKPRL